MDFKILTEEEIAKLSNKERREYLKAKKEYDNKKLVSDTLESAEEEVTPVIKPEPVPVEEKKEFPAVEEVKEPVVKEAPSKKEPKAKATETAKTSGRPKGRPSSRISVNIPDEFLDYIEVASGIKFKGNTSGYIASLIEKDIADNKAVYDQIKKFKNK